MKTSNELHNLVQSLSKSEKRYFKLTTKLQSGKKNYMKIFDFIESNENYNEEQLKEEYKTDKFIHHLPSEKNHLYKLILKSLRSFYAEQSISSLLKQELKNVEILYSKALFKECEKFVYRAKRLAKDNEKFYYWFEVISWEKKLLERAYEEGNFSSDLDKLVEEEEKVIAKLQNLAAYQIIYSKINQIFRSGGFSRNSSERKIVDEIADHHLIKGKNTALSIRATSMCYYIKGLCAATNRDYKNSFLFFNKTRKILDKTPKIKADLSQRYIQTLTHLLRCYIDNKDFDNAYKLTKDIRSLENEKGFNSTDIKMRIFTNSYNMELILLERQGKFDEALKVLDNLKIEEQKFADKISKEQNVLLMLHRAMTYFGVKDYKQALSNLNAVVNDNEKNLRQDIFSFSRIFNLIIHYELDNYDYLEYIVKSTNRFLKKQDRGYQTEIVFVRHIRKLAKLVDEDAKLKVLQNLKKEVTQLLKEPNEQVLLEYFNIHAWVDSKIMQSDFAEEIMQQG